MLSILMDFKRIRGYWVVLGSRNEHVNKKSYQTISFSNLSEEVYVFW